MFDPLLSWVPGTKEIRTAELISRPVMAPADVRPCDYSRPGTRRAGFNPDPDLAVGQFQREVDHRLRSPCRSLRMKYRDRCRAARVRDLS